MSTLSLGGGAAPGAQSDSASPVQLELARMEARAERWWAFRRLQRETREFNTTASRLQHEIDAAVLAGKGRGWRSSSSSARTPLPRWSGDDELVFDERTVAPNQVPWFRRLVGEPDRQWYPQVRLSGFGHDLLAAGRREAQAPRLKLAMGTRVHVFNPSNGARLSVDLPFDVVFLARELVSASGRTTFRRDNWLFSVAAADVAETESLAMAGQLPLAAAA